MQRVLWLMVAASVLVWAGALLDPGRKRPRGQAAGSDEPTPAPAAQSSGSTVARAPSASATPAPQSAQQPPARAAAAASPSASQTAATPRGRPPQGGVYVIGKQPAGTATARASAGPASAEPVAAEGDFPRGELGEGLLSPEYAEIEQDYVLEVRDGPWALGEEQRVRGLLANSGVATQVALVSCQDTVCRIVLQGDSPELFEQLVQVPGLTDATGVGKSTPYSLRGGLLSVYFKAR